MTSFAQYVRSTGGKTLTAFGDSITAGASVEPDVRWANRLSDALGLHLHNKGISGTVLQNSADADNRPRANNGFSRFRQDLLGPERSDLVVILYGTNDARHTGAPASLNLAGFRRDYWAMLSTLIAVGYSPDSICIGSPAWFPEAGFAVGDPEFTGQSREGFEAFVAAVHELARETGVFYAPVYDSMKAERGDSLVLADLIHPNPAGHAVIADAFANACHIE